MATTTIIPRRPKISTKVKDFIYDRALVFRYFEDGIRTKEEKIIFLTQLAGDVAQAHGAETGEWDVARTGHQVRNLKRERYAAKGSGAEKRSMGEDMGENTCKRPKLSVVETMMVQWQTVLTTSSQLNRTLNRSSFNRGLCNEVLVRDFLRAMLSSAYIGIGTGEVIGRTPQNDVVIYNTEFPSISMPGAVKGSSDSSCCASFHAEAVMLAIEVKTTLTNQELVDTSRAMEILGDIPCMVFAFDSQVSLKSIDVSNLSPNVRGIFTLSHGCLFFPEGEEDCMTVYPSQRSPLYEFYSCVVDAIERYATKSKFDRLAKACAAMSAALE